MNIVSGFRSSITRHLKSRLLKSRGLHFDPTTRFNGVPIVKMFEGSIISLGPKVILNSKPLSNDIICSFKSGLITLSDEATILIGEDTGISGTIISARKSIVIGKRVLIGSGCLITDSDHHPANIDDVSSRRHAVPRSKDTSPISIEDDVFIGARSILLKGVTIGRGSVIAAGSVVTKSIPAGVIAGGNPCSVISRIV